MSERRSALLGVFVLSVGVIAPGAPAIDPGLAGSAEGSLWERLKDQGKSEQQGGGQRQQGGKQQAARGKQGSGAKPQQARGQQGGGKPQQARGQQGGKQQQARGQGRVRQEPARGQQARANRPAQSQQAARGKQPENRGKAASAERRQARGQQRAIVAERARGRPTRDDVIRQVRALPGEMRALERSPRVSDRLLVGALALGVARGMDDDVIRFERADDRLRVFNRDRDLLFDMDERRARDLGAWDMRLLGDQRARGNGPAFCRSGAGHPVWGRQWCLDKGFGLGGYDDRWLWSRRDVDDIVFRRRVDRDRLGRDVLIDVLGDVVFGRLALHALTLGYSEPLAGTWVAQPQGPHLLLINSGDYAVAELVDVNYDDRVDVLFVTQPAW